MEITLREGAKLNARSPRKVSDSIRKLIRDECHRLLELGFITESLSEVTCPVVPVIQKGKFRLCNDYRELNTFTVPIRFPIPLIENSLRKFQTLPWKIQLDMIKSFNQIILHESSRYLSAFITLDGVYEWNRVPFGLRNSPSYLNYVMKDIIFKDMDDIVECFFDDILIGAETEVLLLEKFNLVMNRAKMFNLHFNMDKCKFGYTVVSYLGHMLTADGIHMSQDRKLAIQNIPSPKSKKELQRFLGITNYFHKFIKGYATLAAPLSAMTGTTKIFEWNAKEEESFQTLKQQISLSDHLYFIDYNLPIVLRVDASQYGVGGVLLNVKNGEERCIEFISHSFSEAARKWSTYEQEAYAIYYCVIKLESYLFGIKFTLETDHRNLLWLDQASAPKVIRWRLRLQEYDFNIVHIPGKTNFIADYLSRIQINTIQVDINNQPRTNDDNQSNNHDNIIQQFHNSVIGHHGEIRTLKSLKAAGYHWENMKNDIHNYISSCTTCQKIRDMNYKFSNEFGKIPYYSPGEALFSDGLGPLPMDEYGNKYIISFISSGDHFINLFAVPSLDAKTTANCLLHIFASTGCPRILWSDQGSNYTSNVIKEFCKYFNIEQKFSLPYRPQANGIVERGNREILKHLRAIVYDKRVISQWSTYLPMVQHIINSAYLFDVGTTPMRMRYGDSTFHSNFLTKYVKRESELYTAEQHIQKLNQQLYEIISASNNHNNRLYNQSMQTTNTHDIKPGDYVLVSYPGSPPSKLSPMFRGPMIVLDKIRDDGYLCQDIVTQKQLEISKNRIKKFSLPRDFNHNLAQTLAAADHEEFVVEEVLDYKGNIKNKKSLKFLIKWLGYDLTESTWEPWASVKKLSALDDFLRKHPELIIK